MFSYDELEREFERVAKKQKTTFYAIKPGHTEEEIADQFHKGDPCDTLSLQHGNDN